MEKYTAEQVVEKLKELAGWTFNDEGLHRNFKLNLLFTLIF